MWIKTVFKTELKVKENDPKFTSKDNEIREYDLSSNAFSFPKHQGENFKPLNDFYVKNVFMKKPWDICRAYSWKEIVLSPYPIVRQFCEMVERFDPNNPLTIEVCLDFEYIPKSFSLHTTNIFPVRYSDKLSFFLRIYGNNSPTRDKSYILIPIYCYINPIKIQTLSNCIYPRSAAQTIENCIFSIEADSLCRIVDKIYASQKEFKEILKLN